MPYRGLLPVLLFISTFALADIDPVRPVGVGHGQLIAVEPACEEPVAVAVLAGTFPNDDVIGSRCVYCHGRESLIVGSCVIDHQGVADR